MRGYRTFRITPAFSKLFGCLFTARKLDSYFLRDFMLLYSAADPTWASRPQNDVCKVVDIGGDGKCQAPPSSKNRTKEIGGKMGQ